MTRLSQSELMKKAFQYESALISYAYSMCRDWSAAEDVVHEAYIVLMEKWELYSPDFSVYTWVRKMVYFKALEHLRKRDRDVAVDLELAETVRVAMDMEVGDEAVELHARKMQHLDGCMEKLGEHAKAMLVSYYWHDHSCADIADRLKRSVNSIWLTLSRVRKSLRECVERQLRGEPAEIILERGAAE